MNDQIKNILKNITDFWGNLSQKTKKLLIGGLVGLVIVALIITFILNNKSYVVLFKDINEEETVEVMQQLQENNVDYKYEKDGTILIPEEQESTLRMQLAQAGHPRSGSNYDLFTQNIDFMTTDYEKRKYEVFQLQERMQDSIKTIDGIEDVLVTINVPEEKSFAWETAQEEASASIKLNLRAGASITPSQTSGIVQLVAKSVEGLKEENIAIIDSNGNSLAASDDMLKTDAIKLKLQVEKEFEQEIEERVKTFLITMYGPDNVQVSAKSTINFDKKISEMLKYIPEEKTNTGVISESQTDKEVTGPEDAVGGIIGAETNAEVSTYPGVTVKGDDIYVKDSNTINYLVSQLKEQVEHNPGSVENLTVAVVINKQGMSDEEKNNVKELVANAAGVDKNKIALQNMTFYDSENPEGSPVAVQDPMESDNNKLRQILIYGGIALGIAAILSFIISVLVSNKRKKKQGALLAENKGKSNDSNKGNKPDDYSWKDVHDEIVLHETEEQVLKNQLKEFTRQNPEIAAQLIRTLIKGDDD